MNEEYKSFSKKKIFRDIKRDLLFQLERNGTNGRHYKDLVNDYMVMWITKSMLVHDIKERGVLTKYDNGGGQIGLKKNDSIDQQVRINRQMLQLLNQLGIKPEPVVDDLEDDL